MTLRYLTLAKMARRAVSLENLRDGDTLVQTMSHAIKRRLDRSIEAGPPVYDVPSVALLDYFTHKRAQVRACYFRQRYGRDYWTGKK